MTTAREQPAPRAGLVASRWVLGALQLSALGFESWALAVLLRPGSRLLFLLPVAGGVAAVARLARRDQDDEAAVVAIVRHADPGPSLRDRAAQIARVTLGRRAVDSWAPVVVTAGLAVACVAAAVARADWPTGLPAPFLLAWGVAWLRFERTSARRAWRWLIDPPGPVDDGA